MKKLNYFKAMSLWGIVESATSDSIISSLNEDGKYTQEDWDKARREFYDKLNQILSDNTERSNA